MPNNPTHPKSKQAHSGEREEETAFYRKCKEEGVPAAAGVHLWDYINEKYISREEHIEVIEELERKIKPYLNKIMRLSKELDSLARQN